MDLTFENTAYLLLLVLLPVMALALTGWRKQRMQLSDRIVSKTLFEKISIRKYDNFGRRRIMLITAVGLLIIAIVNPQLPGEKQKITKESSDIFIAFDISRSMLAQDIAPDRLTKAKLFAVRLTQSLRTERIGLIVFAGAAYVYMPMTSDYNAAIDFINGLSTEMASYQGTALGEAIEVAGKVFTEESNRSKGLIIISDGEDHDSNALKAAETAAKNGIVITTLGVGTEKGGLIPDMVVGGSNFKMDENGNPVRSKLNETILKQLAAKTQGAYYNINDVEDAITGVKEMVSKLDKGDYLTEDTSNNISLYPLFLWPAFFLILIEFLMSLGLFTRKQSISYDL